MKLTVECLESRNLLSNGFASPVISDTLNAKLQQMADIQIAANQAAGLVQIYPMPAAAAPLVPPLEVPAPAAMPTVHQPIPLSSLVPPIPQVQLAPISQPVVAEQVPAAVTVLLPASSPILSNHLTWALQAISDEAMGLPIQPWNE